MKSKKLFSCGIIADCGAEFQAAPQKIVNTSTDVISGPLRYVSCGAAPGATISAPACGCSGTIRIASPCSGAILRSALPSGLRKFLLEALRTILREVLPRLRVRAAMSIPLSDFDAPGRVMGRGKVL